MAATQRGSFFVLICGVCLLAAGGCGSPPQMSDDPTSFKEVEALWTALGSKRADLLTQTEKSLNALHTAGKLPDDAHQSLQSIVDTAKAGDWQSARTTLRAFMEGQRRGR